jgi:hypothetical protein
LSTVEATFDVAAGIIKLNISGKEDTFTFKPNGTKQCNEVMVMIKLERNAMTPDKKPSAAKNFLPKFSRRIRSTMSAVIGSLVPPVT